MRVDEHLSAGTMTCAISPRGLLEPDDRLKRCQKSIISGCAMRSTEETRMDTTTLLIIVLLILLLGGGGWYGRGRWY
jgi:hypothetical protein